MIRAQLVHLGMNIGTDAEQEIPLACDDAEWKMITDRMAAKKFNMIVIDLNEGVRWEGHPEIGVKGAWSVEKLRQELVRLRSLGLEPIPKFNFSATHDAWLGEWGRMLGSEEWRKTACELIAEAAEVFGHPRFFHLGLDEEDVRCQSAHELTIIRQGKAWFEDYAILEEAVHHAGGRAWIWADLAWERPNFLRDLARYAGADKARWPVMSNWYYDEGLSKRAFRWPRIRAYLDIDAAGFDQIPTSSNHLHPDNARETVAFCRAHLNAGQLLGFLQTSWRRCLPKGRARNLAAVDQLAAAMD